MDITKAIKHHINNNKNNIIQYNDKIYKITIITHDVQNFNKSDNKMINQLMIVTYCIYNQYKIIHNRNSNCWLCGGLCGFFNKKYYQYETIFGNYIVLHKDCFERCYNIRKNSNYTSLSVKKYEDYHCLKIGDIYSIYNDKCLKFLSYKEDIYIPYPNIITDLNFYDAYKNWSLKYLVKINIPKLLYFKKYLNHNDVFMYIKIIYSRVVLI